MVGLVPAMTVSGISQSITLIETWYWSPIPPVFLAPRHGLGGFLLGFAFGRIAMRGPCMNLATLTDCPAVSQFPQRVRFNPERERVSFGHDRITRQRGPGRQGEIRPPHSNWPT